MNLEEFKNIIKKNKLKRTISVTNSFGFRNAHIFYNKHRKRGTEYVVPRNIFSQIINEVNKLLALSLILGNDVIFPHKMGKIYVEKYYPKTYIKNNKVYTQLNIDWNKTLDLWYEDEESRKNKTLVRLESKEMFHVKYDKSKAIFNNKSFYDFTLGRGVKDMLKLQIRNNNIDTFINKSYERTLCEH